MIRTSWFAIGFYMKKTISGTNDNQGYSMALTLSLMWFQTSWEITLWEDWRI